MKRAIEEYFPIIEINRLAAPERDSFKPIYLDKGSAKKATYSSLQESELPRP
jgi:putative DNA methylase